MSQVETNKNLEVYIINIQKGDLVDFGCYGKLYVCGIHGLSEDTFWVTDREDHRFKSNCDGWSIKRSYALNVIEKAVK